MKMILALAFVPPGDVIYAFESLAQEIPDEAACVMGYIEDNYIVRIDSKIIEAPHRQRPRNGIEKWNVYNCVLNDSPRTNNSVEGWHNGFAKLCRTNPSIYDFVIAIQKQQSMTEFKNEQLLLAGDDVPPSKSTYRNLNHRVKNIVQGYCKDYIVSYLKGISHNIYYFVKAKPNEHETDEAEQ